MYLNATQYVFNINSINLTFYSFFILIKLIKRKFQFSIKIFVLKNSTKIDILAQIKVFIGAVDLRFWKSLKSILDRDKI